MSGTNVNGFTSAAYYIVFNKTPNMCDSRVKSCLVVSIPFTARHYSNGMVLFVLYLTTRFVPFLKIN